MAATKSEPKASKTKNPIINFLFLISFYRRYLIGIFLPSSAVSMPFIEANLGRSSSTMSVTLATNKAYTSVLHSIFNFPLLKLAMTNSTYDVLTNFINDSSFVLSSTMAVRFSCFALIYVRTNVKWPHLENYAIR